MNGLTEQQTKTLVWVAENGPCSIRRVSEEIGRRNYKNVYLRIRKLERLGHLAKYGSKKGDATKEKGWWITPGGLVEALDQGAKPGEIMDRCVENVSERVAEKDMILALCGLRGGLTLEQWRGLTRPMLLLTVAYEGGWYERNAIPIFDDKGKTVGLTLKRRGNP